MCIETDSPLHESLTTSIRQVCAMTYIVFFLKVLLNCYLDSSQSHSYIQVGLYQFASFTQVIVMGGQKAKMDCSFQQTERICIVHFWTDNKDGSAVSSRHLA